MNHPRERVKCSLLLLGLVVLFSFSSPVPAQDGQWELEKQDDGIRVYSRPVEGSAYNEIRGTATIEGRVTTVVALLQDPEFVPKLNDVISQVRVHEEVSPTEALVYLQMDMPWPVNDRDLLTRRTIERDCDSNAVIIREVAETGVIAEKDDFIRIVDSTQEWTLKTVNDGVVELDWTTHTDPNGTLPSAIVNWLSVGVPHSSLQVLRDAVESGEYSDVEFTHLKDCQAVDEAVSAGVPPQSN